MGLFDSKGLPPGVGSVIGGGLSALGGLGSGIFSALSAKSNREWQERQAAIERQWQGMPAQVMRARQAGLNPNLVFGKGTGVTNVPSTPSAPSMPVMPNIFESAPDVGQGLEERQLKRKRLPSEIGKNYAEGRAADASAYESNAKGDLYTIDKESEHKLRMADYYLKYNQAIKEGNESTASYYKSLLNATEYEIVQAQKEDIKQKPKKENEYIDEQKKTEKTKQEYNRKAGDAAVSTAESLRQKTVSEIALNKELENKAAKEALKAFEESTGVELDNTQKRQLMPIVKKSMEKHVRQQGADYWNPFRYVGGIMSGAAAAGIKLIGK